MKMKILPLVAFFATIITIAQTPCENNIAAGYPCDGYDLLSNISLGEMNASGGNDSWGWTDPETGIEYALVGLSNGTAFIDISDPINPIYLGKLPTHTDPSIWRDIKVYNNYAFIVSEAEDHGMQVFDLTRLRDVENAPMTFWIDAIYTNVGSVHNIVINEETGYAYTVGGNEYNGGPHFIDISNPLNPTDAGGYGSEGYSHDAQVIVYDGPDSQYVGREIYFGSHASKVVILDVTDKNNPQLINSFLYPSTGYTHQNWLTEDRNYMLLGDEADEFDFGFNTRTVIFDVSDLENISLHHEYYGETSSVDHNGYVLGNKYYLANYSSGLSVIDISDIENQDMSQIGYFDIFPSNNNANYDGAWNVYPYFESGNILITGSNGFTLVRDANLNTSDLSNSEFSINPNPAKDRIVIKSSNQSINNVEIYNILGQKILDYNFSNSNFEELNTSNLKSGMYLVKINNNTTKRLIIK